MWTATVKSIEEPKGFSPFIKVSIEYVNSNKEATSYTKTYNFPFGIENPMDHITKMVNSEVQNTPKMDVNIDKLKGLIGTIIEING